MVVRVERVFKLPGKKVATVPGRHFARKSNAGLITSLALEQNQFRAELPDELAPLVTRLFGHQDGDVITARRADHGQGDARIAAGAFQDDRVRPQQSPPFGVRHDRGGKAVLDTAARIEKLAFDIKRESFRFEL